MEEPWHLHPVHYAASGKPPAQSSSRIRCALPLASVSAIIDGIVEVFKATY
jgi:hypothetical protein